jgi:hypothetical protein
VNNTTVAEFAFQADDSYGQDRIDAENSVGLGQTYRAGYGAFSLTPVPEPGVISQIGSGLLLVAYLARRGRRISAR